MPDPALPRGLAEAVSFAVSRGITVSTSTESPLGTGLSHAPFIYRPTPFSSACYNHALSIAVPLNYLVTRIARDPAYLRAALAETAAADADFTGRLLALLQPDGAAPTSRIELSISRVDYFQHAEPSAAPELRMVELNTVAASFACLSTRLTELHRHLAAHPAAPDVVVPDPAALPANDGATGLARGMSLAHAEFVRLYPEAAPQPAIVMVVQPGERNLYDQYFLQEAVWRNHGVQMVRVSLAAIKTRGKLDRDGHLSVVPDGVADADAEVHRVTASIVYFRAGYVPDDYHSETEWEARALIERCTAAKCPSVAMQLVGTKKVQQLLDRPGEVERFLNEPGDVEAIRRTFARQYSLSEKDGGAEAAALGIERPEDFVLKPQREGGGHNLYGTDIRDALTRMNAEERAAYVLMERIHPVKARNIIVRNGRASNDVDIVSEFGMYGVHVECDGALVDSYAAGSLLRSKFDGVDEGGVSAGAAALDSPLLTDWKAE